LRAGNGNRKRSGERHTLKGTGQKQDQESIRGTKGEDRQYSSCFIRSTKQLLQKITPLVLVSAEEQ
jgi:hypothetical protein